jgi:class 3 adenylate cyclase
MLQQQHGQEQEGEQLESSPNGSFRRGSVHAGQRSSLPGNDYDVPVVYKQWHSAVTVLFADISSYTAMSTQVEPEEVRIVWLRVRHCHVCCKSIMPAVNVLLCRCRLGHT